jgi:hypothetical protein
VCVVNITGVGDVEDPVDVAGEVEDDGKLVSVVNVVVGVDVVIDVVVAGVDKVVDVVVEVVDVDVVFAVVEVAAVADDIDCVVSLRAVMFIAVYTFPLADREFPFVPFPAFSRKQFSRISASYSTVVQLCFRQTAMQAILSLVVIACMSNPVRFPDHRP